MSAERSKLNGFLLKWGVLAVIIVVYIAITKFYLSDYYTSFHPLVAASNTSSPSDLCARLNYSRETCSPLLYTLWLASRVIQSEIVAYLFMIIGVVVVYAATRMLTTSYLASIVASLLYAFTPSSLYPSLLDYYGFVLLTPLILATIVLTIKGLVGNNKKLVVFACALQVIIVLVHTAYWATLLALSLYSLVTYVNRRLTLIEKTVLLYFAMVTAPRLVFGVFGYEYFFTILAVILALSVIIVDYLTDPRDTSVRSLLILPVLVLAVLFSTLLNSALGVRELYVRLTTSPIIAYGFAGFLALGGLIFSLRWRASVLHYVFSVLLVAFTILSLIVPSTTLIAIAFMSALGGRLLEAVFTSTRAFKSRSKRITSQLLVAILIVLVVFASITAAVDQHYAAHPALARISPLLDKPSQVRIHKWLSRVSEELASRILENTTGKILVVSNWEYSFWLYEELSRRGLDVYLLTSTVGNIGDKSLIAKVFTASEQVSMLILGNISSSLGIRDAYIIIICDYSVRAPNRAYLGYPITVVSARGEETLFRTISDMFLTPLYLTLANRTVRDYVYTVGFGDEGVLALTWTKTGADMLISKLVVSALYYLNYTSVYNYNYFESYEYTGYTSQPTPIKADLTWFTPIYVDRVNLVRITARGETYDVYLLLAVFRVNFK
ncbi:MAG: hypothetical protein LM556_02120 [Desulfurococcaceae archaeon]|nr:hypothetical protein [Desulfurococcaceae archaeon]